MERYPSKILLFGEYSILLGSHALAIPFNRFGGEWAFMEQVATNSSSFAAQSNKNLKEFLNYLKLPSTAKNLSHFPDIEIFEADLNNGLYFKSDIPEGAGFGSSGALTAAVLKRYDTAGIGFTSTEIRKSLSRLESYFHGTSSGIDPLVSYSCLPVFIKENNKIVFADVDIRQVSSEYGLFIVQGVKPGSTEYLIKKFRIRGRKDKNYFNRIRKEYIPVNNYCADVILNRKAFGILFSHLRSLIPMQIGFFNEMISEEMIPLMEYGIIHNLFGLKLCGSGGGGHMLGFTGKPEKTKEFFQDKQYTIIFC